MDDDDKDCNGDDSCDENCNWEEMSYWALILRDGFDDVVMMTEVLLMMMIMNMLIVIMMIMTLMMTMTLTMIVDGDGGNCIWD